MTAAFVLRAGFEPNWTKVAADADYCDELVTAPGPSNADQSEPAR